MLQDAWRAMRDHFWVEDLSGVDWARVRRRYLPLVERVATRSEFSDLMWEMQGELGTSHCYELGGDYRTPPPYDVGFLAAHFAYDPRRRGYRIERIVRGDPGEPEASSPLLSPGANIKEGDVIVAINGRPLSKRFSPQEALVALAGQEIRLTLSNGRSATVRALASETLARYRDWVNANRAHVHRRTRGRVGYVHIPDMGAPGYSEFHRQFLHELDRPGLIVDVRYNGGGHVSQLLLEKLARRRLAYVKRRWGAPEPYPEDAPCGPMVCLTNEEAGSDGDIFSHCWKMLRLGPLVGRRTWGGVIGIWPRHMLVDGSFTTQPEYSFWFLDAGFGIENHGTEPDVDVDIAPHDFVAGRDPQLDRAIEVALGLLRDSPPRAPTFEPRPRLTLPLLPNGRPKPARQRTRPTAPARR
jgi:tricorn protease